MSHAWISCPAWVLQSDQPRSEVPYTCRLQETAILFSGCFFCTVGILYLGDILWLVGSELNTDIALEIVIITEIPLSYKTNLVKVDSVVVLATM